MQPSLPASSVRLMLAELGRLGLAAGPALAASGLRVRTLDNPTAEVTREQEFAFQRAFARLTAGRPDVWLRVGQQYHLLTYGIVGMAVLSTPTLRRAFEVGLTFHQLLFTRQHMTLHESRGTAHFEMSGVAGDDDMREFEIWRDLGAVQTAFNDLWQGPFPFRQATLALPAPAATPWREIRTLLGVPLRFDAPQTALQFDARYLAARPAQGNPLLEDMYVRQMRALVARFRDDSDIVEAVVDLLLRAHGDWPGQAAVASRLGISERTLRRRLDAAGVGFRTLVEQVRAQRARDLLRDSRLGIAAIAEVLGYAQCSAFSHAFERWTGLPPLRYRAAKVVQR